MSFMMNNCFPMPGTGKEQSTNSLGEVVKNILGNIGGDSGEDIVRTCDGKITITDKETLEIARLLLARVEKKLNEPPVEPPTQPEETLDPFVDGTKGVIPRPSDFNLEVAKKPRYSHRGPYQNRKK